MQTLADDTAVMAYLLDPAEGKYRLDDLALRFLSVELVSPDVEAGTLDFDGRGDGPRRPAGGGGPAPGAALREALVREPSTSTSGSSCRSCAC